MPSASSSRMASRRFASRSPIFEPRDNHAVFNALASEQRILKRSQLARDLEIIERAIRADAPARSAVNKAELHQVRFVNLLDGVRLLVDGRRDGPPAHRTTAVYFQQPH